MQENNLTICICAYNAEKYIVKTLRSLYEQTYRDFDFLLIDDCSSDKTQEVVQAFIDEHQWASARIVHLDENGGLAHGRHVAEKLVNTEYLGFFDADDLALPTYVEKLYSRIQQDPNCMAVGCFCEYIDEQGKRIGGGIHIGNITPEEFYDRASREKLMFMSASSLIRVSDMKRAGGRNINGFPSGKPRYQDMCEDLDLWTRMSDFYKEGKYIVVVPEVLFQYRKMVSSMSANGRAMSMRMRHIKCNLKRRRRGEAELSFIDYLASLTTWQKIKYAYSDWSQGFYKQAGFRYMQKHYLRFMWNFGCAALFNPGYFLQKMKHNAKNNPGVEGKK